ncbi:MAG: CopG family transcriptional regulator [Acidimicrobiia bacterium]|nr:CopG family transcriptional regulator [Acidimicrobiia bacterium]
MADIRARRIHAARVNCRVPDAHVQTLDRLAASAGALRSDVLRQAIEEFIEQHNDLPAGHGISPPCPAGAPTLEES